MQKVFKPLATAFIATALVGGGMSAPAFAGGYDDRKDDNRKSWHKDKDDCEWEKKHGKWKWDCDDDDHWRGHDHKHKKGYDRYKGKGHWDRDGHKGKGHWDRDGHKGKDHWDRDGHKHKKGDGHYKHDYNGKYKDKGKR